MNNERFSEQVEATYMSQAEANDVMELWARRQKEDAARQSMVTIHDVAEATQLSPQEIQRLLQDVRKTRPSDPVAPVFRRTREEVDLWTAMIKVGPLSGMVSLVLLLIIGNTDFYYSHNRMIVLFALWTLAMFVVAVVRYLQENYRIFRAGKESLNDDGSYSKKRLKSPNQ